MAQRAIYQKIGISQRTIRLLIIMTSRRRYLGMERIIGTDY